MRPTNLTWNSSFDFFLLWSLKVYWMDFNVIHWLDRWFQTFFIFTPTWEDDFDPPSHPCVQGLYFFGGHRRYIYICSFWLVLIQWNATRPEVISCHWPLPFWFWGCAVLASKGGGEKSWGLSKRCQTKFEKETTSSSKAPCFRGCWHSESVIIGASKPVTPLPNPEPGEGVQECKQILVIAHLG